MRRLTVVMALVTSVLVVVAVRAQDPAARGRGQQPPPVNLQVLPKDMTRQQVTALMRQVRAALGVECSHCHAGEPGNLNYALDEKPEKATARKMLQMVAAINGQHLSGVGQPAETGAQKVTCFTCHRGELKPATAPPPGGGF